MSCALVQGVGEEGGDYSGEGFIQFVGQAVGARALVEGEGGQDVENLLGRIRAVMGFPQAVAVGGSTLLDVGSRRVSRHSSYAVLLVVGLSAKRDV